MKVILLKNITGIGRIGDIKDVADGYARNFLFVRKLAAPATAETVRSVEEGRQSVDLKKRRRADKLKDDAKKLGKLTLEFTEKVSPAGKLYAAIGSQRIADELQARGFGVARQDVILPQAIKEPGGYEVRVALGQGLEAVVRCVVHAGETG